ncbi:ESPR domain-containing protein [Sutterella sp.]|uniref:ESPR domain-containing protein n=1 Tax=Sutterella sp. TaxID=1981025 RepID=UPI0026E10D88|nr:ESPR domain-containing protein [Sutterella sp.]MDO5533016.1 ESPR domain-containing protein [Sutterella sp.]
MNRTYRVIFSKARGALMAVNELTASVQKKGTKTVIAAVAAAVGLFGAGTAAAETYDDSTTETVFETVKDLPGTTTITDGAKVTAKSKFTTVNFPNSGTAAN